MMAAKAPRRTVGHHFSDLLTCPQRAWLHYRGDYGQMVRDPSYLLALQREGLEHERDVYQTLYPHACKINDRSKHRADETFQAMSAGEDAILQGYVGTEDGEGIIDILEKVGPDPLSLTGYCYRVGEIKRARTLKTYHVLQTTWYTELLERVYHQHSEEVFFILGNGLKETVHLTDVWPDYERARADLIGVRDTLVPPGPFLTSFCPSCHWRAVCMPQLVECQHLSLLPGVSRTQAQLLAQRGVQSWPAVKSLSDDDLSLAGWGAFEIDQIRTAVRQLENGILPLRRSLRQNLLSGVLVVVMEFPDLSAQRREPGTLQPAAIYLEGPAGVSRIPVQEMTADVSSLTGNDVFVLYGKTDLSVFRKIIAKNGAKLKQRPIDLLDLIETNLHGPLMGLELDVLHQQITGTASGRPLRGEERLRAVRLVVDWLGKSIA